MEPYTLDRKFLRQDTIDGFSSLIWTERYYGNSEVELVVPATQEMIKKLPEGVFLGIDKSDEIMILESASIEEGILKLTGMSLLPWMNNRFVRSSDKHKEVAWSPVTPGTAGWTLWAIIYYFCCTPSYYLDGSHNIGIPNPQRLAIPGLGLKDHDKSGDPIIVSIPYGPVYDAMATIALEHEIGMQITLESATDTAYSLGFRSYKGLDRTSGQNLYPPVRFSPEMDSLTNIKELRSIAALKTLVYAFATAVDPDDPAEPLLTTVAGESHLTGSSYTGFDLRAQMVLDGDIKDTEEDPLTQAKVVERLNNKAKEELTKSPKIEVVDGEIVPTSQFQYGVHYNLGDLIEVQGNSGIIQKARVTEYIHTQDEAGEKAYPTITMLN